MYISYILIFLSKNVYYRIDRDLFSFLYYESSRGKDLIYYDFVNLHSRALNNRSDL